MKMSIALLFFSLFTYIVFILYHEFATQENKFSCAEFMNDKIIKHEVRQACNAWILELLYHIC